MFPIFTICFIIFLVVLNYRIHKSSNDQQELQEQFWERERQANLTRRKDISDLNYITIPEDLFPMNLHTDAESEIASLREKKMLNLTGLSNTDLKLQYGAQNLNELSACDDIFTQFVRLLPVYAEELLASGQTNAARRLLEFGVEHRTDSKAIFTKLALLYQTSGESNRIQHLIGIASELNSLSQGPIISALQEIQNPEIAKLNANETQNINIDEAQDVNMDEVQDVNMDEVQDTTTNTSPNPDETDADTANIDITQGKRPRKAKYKYRYNKGETDEQERGS